MKTIQNHIWMRCLTLGLIISSLLLLNSCKDYFYDMVGEYHFVNETDYPITYSAGYEEFNIAPKSTVIIRQSVRSAGRKEGALESDYISPLSSQAAVLTIKFDIGKCLVNIKLEDLHSVRNIKNFQTENLGNNHYKFTYIFTEADYNRATTCP